MTIEEENKRIAAINLMMQSAETSHKLRSMTNKELAELLFYHVILPEPMMSTKADLLEEIEQRLLHNKDAVGSDEILELE